jgi:peptidoglycan/LPS O-acetylase OafA/YrhL
MSFVVIMFIGTIIERARRGKISWKATNMIALLTFSLLVGVADTPSHFMSMLARCIGFTIFSGALLLPARRIPSSLRRLGVISYSIYLMHPLVITLIPQIGSATVTGLIWLGSSIVVAALTYGLIELPAMTFGRQLTSRVHLRQTIADGYTSASDGRLAP